MVKAIRGATTVSNNDKHEIINETQKLLDEIIKENHLSKDDIISIIFTATKDLDAAFPAVAAREIGMNDVALMCMNEIDVPDSLKKCIRVMFHVNTDTDKIIRHIYLNDSKVLRPDLE
ncbi:chorismate mutase [Herbivorax sp. ANBcel31]|uniref:chorismate mutase n=1 Tax=Herbivorax sp. ANBcel31 TaxID=3069754 RepID=UPI0027B64A56|nr:chorismate mutase [Herbivorax sp. ANBcel31]MDQ2085789.1 chorismate mutase [Herbivorax sp. ANBcel31]